MSILSMKSEWCPTRLKYLWNFVVEKETDVEDLPHCHEGSTATVQETGNAYVINSAGTWSVGERDDSVVSPANKVYVTDSSGVPGWVERTHYDAVHNVAWDGDTSGHVLAAKTGHLGVGRNLVKVSDLTPTPENLLAGDASVTITAADRKGVLNDPTTTKFSGATETSEKGWAYHDNFKGFFVAYEGGYEYTYSTDEYTWVTFTMPEPGIYFAVLYKKNTPMWICSALEWRDLKQLDDKYIPSTIARKTDLEGLGGGSFIVNATVTLNEGSTTEGTCTFDKTYEETLAAWQAGQHVVCDWEDEGTVFRVPAVQIVPAGETVLFALFIGGMTIAIVMGTDGGTITLTE